MEDAPGLLADAAILFAGVDPDAKIRGPCDAKNVVGAMAEELVRWSLTARPWNGAPFEIPTDVATCDDGSPYELVPDGFDASGTRVLEIKAGMRRFYVSQRQVRAYRWAHRHATWPVPRPRIAFAFVGYGLPQAAGSYRTAADLATAFLAGIRYVTVLDFALIEHLLGEYGSYDEHTVTPLSPMLGTWQPYYRFTRHRVAQWATAPRAGLRARLPSADRWRVRRLTAATPENRLYTPYGQVPACPMVALAPCRRRRPWSGVVPAHGKGQAQMFSEHADAAPASWADLPDF